MCEQKIYSKFHDIIKVVNFILSNNKNDCNEMRYLGIFRYVLNSLKEDYLFILKNSYFNKSYRFWWIDFYSKTTYYRKRYIAVNSFVSLFEMIYENFNDCSVYLTYA